MRRKGDSSATVALIVSLPTAVSGSLFFPLRSPGVYAWGGGPKQPFSFPAFPLQGTLCVQSPEERPLKGPKEKGKEFFCCPCDPAVNGWATERRKRACPASIWQPYDQGPHDRHYPCPYPPNRSFYQRRPRNQDRTHPQSSTLLRPPRRLTTPAGDRARELAGPGNWGRI